MILSNIVLFLFAIGFAGGEVLRYQAGNGIAITFLDILVGLLAVWWYGKQVIFHKKLHGSLLFPLGIFLVICLISLIVNLRFLSVQQVVTAFLYLLRLAAYVSLYFIIKDTEKKERARLFQWVSITGTLSVALGYLQYFFFNSLRPLYPLGWDNHLYRLFGMYLDPNFTGVIYVLFFLVLIDQIMKRAKNTLQDKPTIILIVLTILTGVAIVLTYSRTALVMLSVSLVVLASFRWNKMFFLIVIGALLLSVIALSNFWVEGTNPFRAVSTRERIISMTEAVTIIERNPVLGVGFNAYRYAQHRYGLRVSGQWQVSHADAGTDNSFLFVFATTGIIGLISYVYLWRRIIGYQLLIIRQHPFALLALSSTVGLLVSSLFLNTLFYPFVLFWIFGLYGVTESTKL